MNNKIDKETFQEQISKTISEDLAKKLKEARKSKGYTILQLSKLTGMSDSYLSNVENNRGRKVSLNVYLYLCYCLDIEPDDFFKDITKFEPFTKN